MRLPAEGCLVPACMQRACNRLLVRSLHVHAGLLIPPRSHLRSTPFISRIRALLEERGVSTIMVIGGSGCYFAVADVVRSFCCCRGVSAAPAEKPRRATAASLGPVDTWWEAQHKLCPEWHGTAFDGWK